MTAHRPELLIVEDDERFAETLAAEFRDRGYRVRTVRDLEELRQLKGVSVDYALVDLRLRGDSGIDGISIIRRSSPNAKIVVLTGYGSIATAVQATKQGADAYLTKPVDIEMVESAFQAADCDAAPDSEDTAAMDFPSLARHEREYIEYVLAESDGNISETARRLGLHRQSLQRKLRKHTPR